MNRGFTLAELIVGLFLATLVAGLLTSTMFRAARTVELLLRQAEGAEILRVVTSLLEDELSQGRPGVDWALDGPRALRLRAFRGWARVCHPATNGSWVVRWMGDRAPDSARDSVLMLDPQGRWWPGVLEATGPAPSSLGYGECAPLSGESAATWRVSAEGPPSELIPLFVRYFESGRYSLEDGAFRYRRGSGARQPLTPEAVGPESGFQRIDNRVEVTLSLPRANRLVVWRLPWALP
jgi:hypothetical protein